MSTKLLTVVNTSIIKEGESAAGKPWTLRQVDAIDAEGRPIDEKLKTFDNLPLNREITVEVEVEEHPKYGKSYMLKATGDDRGPRSATPGLGALAERVQMLEENLAMANTRIAALEQQRGVPAPEEGESPNARQERAAATFGGDDDIPF